MTLEEIEHSFAVWRENRSNPKEKIPNALWQQIASVYSSYPPSVICRRLGLSSQSLKKAMQGDGFAPFSPSPVERVVLNESALCELSLERPNTRLIVKVPMSSFDSALSKLAQYMSC